MTTAAPTMSTNGRSRTVRPEATAHTLSGEHAALLRGVHRRVAPVLALAEAGCWPAAELDTLIRFLRATLLRQASDEEAELYAARSAPLAELTADHVRFHQLTDRLETVASQPGAPRDLRTLVDELITVLERHLRDEQAVLAALPGVPAQVPSAAEVVAGTQTWMPSSDEPVLIMLDALPAEQAVQLCIERLLRLRRGETAEIYGTDPVELGRVRDWMQRFDRARYGWSHTEGGAGLRVTRRRTP